MPRIQVAELFVPIVADASKFESELDGAGNKAIGWAKSISKAAGAVTFGAMIAGATAATGGVALLSRELGKLAVEAAPLEGIGITFDSMAKRFNLSIREMRDASAGLISDFELMQKANLALTGLTEELGTQFGEKLPELLITARAAARSTGQSYEYMYNSLVNGIKRASPRLIDNTGIVIELGLANKELAKELGTTVEMMSEEEKALAALNAVTKRGMVLAEQMGLEHITAAEALGQMRVSLRNVKDQIGLAFNPAVKAAAVALNDLINTGLKPLAPLLERTVAPAVTVMIEKLHQMAVSAVESGKRVLSGLGRPIARAARNALQWGINISVNLAKGIVTGAARALTAAMNFVSQLLSAWLGPGSPPKVAPNLPEWGANAMEEFLMGFSLANFDILEGTQAMLERALDALVKAGELGEDVAERVFSGISVKLIKAIDKFRDTGRIAQGVLSDLVKFGGQFGDALATLVKRQFAFARATDEVRRAEERLRESRKAEEEAQDELNQQIEKYNQMLRAGASRDALDAQRQRVDAARSEMEAAEEAIAQAERQKEAAEGRVGTLRDQVRLQERLLDQLLKFTRAQEEAEEAGGGGAGAGGGAGPAEPLPSPELGAMPTPEFEPITAAFAEAKRNIEDALEGMFQPLKDALKDPELREAIHNLKDAWHRLRNTFADFWESINGDQLLESLKSLIPESLVENIGEVIGNMAGLAAIALAGAAAVGLLSGALGLLTSPIFLIITTLGILKTAWEEDWGEIRTRTEEAKKEIVPDLESINEQLGLQEGTMKKLLPLALFLVAAKDAWAQATAGLNVVMGTLGEKLGAVWKLLKEQFTPIVERANQVLRAPLVGAFTLVTNVANNFWESGKDIYEFFRDDFLPIMRDVRDFFKDKLTSVFNSFKSDVLEPLGSAFEDIWELISVDLMGALETIRDSLKGSITTTFNNFKNNILIPIKTAFGNIESAIWASKRAAKIFLDMLARAVIPDWAQRDSPSPFEMVWLNSAESMARISQRELPRLRREMTRTARADQLSGQTPGMARMGLEQQMAQVGNHYEYNLTMYTRAERAVVERGFEIMRQRVPGST